MPNRDGEDAQVRMCERVCRLLKEELKDLQGEDDSDVGGERRKWSVKSLAKEVGVTESHFCRVFKKVMGMTVGDYRLYLGCGSNPMKNPPSSPPSPGTASIRSSEGVLIYLSLSDGNIARSPIRPHLEHKIQNITDSHGTGDGDEDDCFEFVDFNAAADVDLIV
jgi:hypothetical protein